MIFWSSVLSFSAVFSLLIGRSVQALLKGALGIRKSGMTAVLLFFPVSATASFQVSSFTDRDQTPLNGSLVFTIQIEFKNKEPKNIALPDFSNLRDFYVLDQWSGSQQSLSLINGKMTSRKTLTKNYTLQPKAQGRLRLDSFDVLVEGQKFKTDPIFIHVTPPSSAPSPLPHGAPFSLSPMFPSPPSFQNLFPDPLSGENRKALIKFQLFLNKKQAYVGEMVTADWVIFSSVKKIQYQIHKLPLLKGFWKKELTPPSNPSVFLGTEVIDKTLYRKELLSSVALFPLESGTLTIDPFTVRVKYFSGFSGEEAIRATAPRSFSVKPLPSAGRGNFSGAVGDFSVQAGLSATEATAGQPVSYKLRFEGRGQAHTIRFPEILFPPSVKTYPPAHKSEFSVKNSWKEFEVLLIPKGPGKVTVPSFTVTTFHPKSGAYRVHRIPALSFQARKGTDSPPVEGRSFFEGPGDNEKWEQLNSVGPFVFHHSALLKFWIVFYTGLTLIFALLCIFRLRAERKIPFQEALSTRFQEIQELINKGQGEKAAVSLINLIYQTVSRLTQRESSLEWEEMVPALPPSLREEFESSLIRLIRDLEALSFAPKNSLQKPSTKKMTYLLNRTQSLIGKMLSVNEKP